MKQKSILIATLLTVSAGVHAHNNTPVFGGGSASSVSSSNAHVVNSISPTVTVSPHQSIKNTNAYSPTNTVSSPSSASTANANNAAQTVETVVPRQTASAASVSLFPTAVCSGTTAGGVQAATFGVSVGSSWTDSNCILLEQAKAVASLGMTDVALEMLCTIPNYADARKALGKPCVRQPAPAKVQAMDTGTWDHNDPYIRRRMGLPAQ